MYSASRSVRAGVCANVLCLAVGVASRPGRDSARVRLEVERGWSGPSRPSSGHEPHIRLRVLSVLVYMQTRCPWQSGSCLVS